MCKMITECGKFPHRRSIYLALKLVFGYLIRSKVAMIGVAVLRACKSSKLLYRLTICSSDLKDIAMVRFCILPVFFLSHSIVSAKRFR